jgi:phosphatidylglycerophosphatase A
MKTSSKIENYFQGLPPKAVDYFISCGRLGFVKKGSGTVTALASLIFWIPFLYLPYSCVWILGLNVVLTILGVMAARVYEQRVGGHDLSEVTIDEWVGMGLSLTFARPVFWQIAVAFALFRLFDIWKPIGVKYFDMNYLNGWGVMMDDVIAGIYAAICLGVLQWYLV